MTARHPAFAAYTRILVVALLVLAAGAAAAALATPPSSLTNVRLARAKVVSDFMVAAHSAQSHTAGLGWYGREWMPRDLPAFLAELRRRGNVDDFNAWLQRHPAAAARLGLPAMRTYEGLDVEFGTNTIQPGGHTGWHSHPGPVVVAVRSGVLTMYVATGDGCNKHTIKTGEAFVEPGHGALQIARNEGSEPVDMISIRIGISAAGSSRIDEADPGSCG